MKTQKFAVRAAVLTVVMLASLIATVSVGTPSADAAIQCYNSSSQGNLVESTVFRTNLARTTAMAYWCKSTTTGQFTLWDAYGSTWTGGGWSFNSWHENSGAAASTSTYKRSYHNAKYCGPVSLAVGGVGWTNCANSYRGLKAWSNSGGNASYRVEGYS